MLETKLLATVAAVAHEGSFERAAQTLHITASAVSQRIRLLEERMGTVLIVRGQPCTATQAGARLCRHAGIVALLEADLRRDMPAPFQSHSPLGQASIRIAVNADSLSTWFIAAMTDFCRSGGPLIELSVDDQDQTSEWLKQGHVLAAVTSLAAPVQGCSSRKLGTLRYCATASPGFVRQWFPAGVTAEAIALAPSLVFDRNDRLQEHWVKRWLRRHIPLPAHRLPSTQAFVEASLAGIGWGMNPLQLVHEHLKSGRLVELVAARPLDVPLYWQVAKLALPELERLSQSVLRASRQALAR